MTKTLSTFPLHNTYCVFKHFIFLFNKLNILSPKVWIINFSIYSAYGRKKLISFIISQCKHFIPARRYERRYAFFIQHWNLRNREWTKEENISLWELTGVYWLVLAFSFDCKFMWSSDRCSSEMELFKSLIRVFDIFFKNCVLPETTLSKYSISRMPW